MFLALVLIVALASLGWLIRKKKIIPAWIVGGLLALALYVWVDIQSHFLTGVVLIVAAGFGLFRSYLATFDPPAGGIASRKPGAQGPKTLEDLPYTAEKTENLPQDCAFELKLRRMEWTFIYADCKFAITHAGRRVIVREGSLVSISPTLAQTELHRSTHEKVNIHTPVTENVWKTTTWNAARIIEEYSQITGDGNDDHAFIGGEVYYIPTSQAMEASGLEGGSAMYWAGSFAGIKMPDCVEEKGYSGLNAEAMVNTELALQDNGHNPNELNPEAFIRQASEEGHLISARAIHDYFFRQEETLLPRTADALDSPIGMSESPTGRVGFPVQTGKMIDPFGVQVSNLYVSGDGNLTIGLSENLSVSEGQFVTKIGGLNVSKDRVTANVAGMEVDLTGRDLFSTKDKKGKTSTFLGEKDDMEMTVLGMKKKKDKGGGFFD